MKKKQISDQKTKLMNLGVELTKLQPVKEKLTSLMNWEKTAVSWISEIHKLTRRFPREEEGFRVTSFSTHPVSTAGSNEYNMQMTIVGEVPGERKSLVREWVDDLDSEPLWRAKTDYLKPASKSGSKGSLHYFSISVDIANKLPEAKTAAKLFGVLPKTGLKKFGSLNKASK